MNQKGFSLLEVLAVIVLLAIIATITVPVVTNILESSKKSAFSSSVGGIKKAIENDYSNRDFAVNTSYEYRNGKLTYTQGANTGNVAITGKIDGNGIGFVDSNGKIYVAVHTSKYCGTVGVENISGVYVTDFTTEDECFEGVRSKM